MTDQLKQLQGQLAGLEEDLATKKQERTKAQQDLVKLETGATDRLSSIKDLAKLRKASRTAAQRKLDAEELRVYIQALDAQIHNLEEDLAKCQEDVQTEQHKAIRKQAYDLEMQLCDQMTVANDTLAQMIELLRQHGYKVVRYALNVRTMSAAITPAMEHGRRQAIIQKELANGRTKTLNQLARTVGGVGTPTIQKELAAMAPVATVHMDEDKVSIKNKA